jgi:lipopolysaccharide export LptBFGC system permease protein LptF
MENRTALRGAGISKGLVVLFAVIVAIGLGVMAAFVAKSVTAPAAATQSNLVQSTYSGPGPDAQERNNHARPLQYADDKPSTGHGLLP